MKKFGNACSWIAFALGAVQGFHSGTIVGFAKPHRNPPQSSTERARGHKPADVADTYRDEAERHAGAYATLRST